MVGKQPRVVARAGTLLFSVGLTLPILLATENPCARCHPKEVEGYARSGMAHSIGRPGNQPGGRVVQPVSGAQFVIESDDRGMRQRMIRDGETQEQEIAYFVGSGHTGHSYLVSRRGYLFQSPVSYYAGRSAWDMSPGYADDPHADFSRPVTSDCLQCHAGRALPIAGTQNRFEEPPFAAEAISCDRCHGPSAAHLAKPARETIVNPKRLTPRARASVCEQCHLAGEARVPNPGRKLADFQPGMELEEVWSVYILDRQAGAASDQFRAVSHAELLARSACARSSNGALWCGSCHNPHERPVDAVNYFRQRCLDCHGEALLQTHPAPADDCIGCHMPKRSAADVAHAAVTDHRIQRNPRQASGGAGHRQLRAWLEPLARFRKRNFGLALTQVSERYRYDLLMQQGLRVLTQVRELFPKDPAVLSAIARGLYGEHKFAAAAALLEAAAEQEPRAADHRLYLGRVYQAMGRTAAAVEAFERAMALDPGREDAYQNLAALYQETDRAEQAREVMLRYEQFLRGR